MNQLWLSSKLKDKIFIGRHSLESSGSGDVHEGRFVATKSGKYDGVHFWGPKGVSDFTQSIKTIFMLAQLTQKSEFGTAQGLQGKQSANYQPTVVTKNRFSTFNQGNY